MDVAGRLLTAQTVHEVWPPESARTGASANAVLGLWPTVAVHAVVLLMRDMDKPVLAS